MTTDTLPPLPRIIDLSGLPEPVVERVHLIVREARESHQDPGANFTPAEPFPRYVSTPPPMTAEAFRALLDEMASLSSGQVLPADWSRADIYDDHD